MPRKLQVEFDHSALFRRLSKTIAYYRRENGHTQEELAEMAGISHRYMSKIESLGNTTSISLDLLFNFAKVLNLEPYQLLKAPLPPPELSDDSM